MVWTHVDPVTSSTTASGLVSLTTHLVEAKHRLGLACARWAGRGPNLAASISMTGMALEHEGHARALQSWLAGEQPCDDEQDVITWDSWLGGARQPRLDWSTTIHTLLYTADILGPTWHVLTGATDERLRLRVARIVDEERRQRDYTVGLSSSAGQPRTEDSAPMLVSAVVLRSDLRASVWAGELQPEAVAAWELAVQPRTQASQLSS